MAAVYWLCKGSIINCLLIEGLSEWFDVRDVNIWYYYEFDIGNTEFPEFNKTERPWDLLFLLGASFSVLL